MLPFETANARRPALAWRPADVARPAFVGRQVLEAFPLAEIRRYIDWRFFFAAWELPARFPQVLDDPEVGATARDLYAAATRLLDEIVDKKLLTANGVYGFWPAQSDGNDIVLYAGEARDRELVRFPMLRQQGEKGNAEPCLALSDFVAPIASGCHDYVGAFAVTAGIGLEPLVRRYEAARDDYGAILAKALADRLAEAFAELLHERARREWYASDERLDAEGLLKERFRGIRPAFGYPACPDHSEKPKLFGLLEAPAVGITLTEHFAMLPAASVSGLYLGHPDARYFAVGRVGRDQVEHYAARKGCPVPQVERWLGPSLGYDPTGRAAA